MQWCPRPCRVGRRHTRTRLGSHHSCPQRPRSFWSAPRIATSVARSNDIPVLNGFVNTIDWDQNQSDLSDLTLSVRRVTGSPWIADFRCWTRPEVAILGADQKERSLWGREWWEPSLVLICRQPTRHGLGQHCIYMWCWWCFIQLILKFIFDFKFLGFSSIFSIFLLVFFL